MEKPSILKFAVLRKRALKLLHLPFPVFLNLGNDKHLQFECVKFYVFMLNFEIF